MQLFDSLLDNKLTSYVSLQVILLMKISSFINHRRDEDNEVQASSTQKSQNRPLTATEIEALVLKAEKEALVIHNFIS